MQFFSVNVKNTPFKKKKRKKKLSPFCSFFKKKGGGGEKKKLLHNVVLTSPAETKSKGAHLTLKGANRQAHNWPVMIVMDAHVC